MYVYMCGVRERGGVRERNGEEWKGKVGREGGGGGG